MPKKKTHEEYVAEVNKINPNIEVCDKYVNYKTPILHKCLIHNVEWMITPSNVLAGQGCAECKKQKISDKKRKTHTQYVDELKNINPNIVPVETYIDVNIPIMHKCVKDNYQWKTSPHSLLNGNGCSMCANRVRRTHDEYVRDVKNINKNIDVIGKFINTHIDVRHKCLICGYEWNAKPYNVLLGTSCPNCAGIMKKEHSKYVEEVSRINEDIEVVEEYKTAKTPILHRCKICGCEWYATPTNILTGKGCPECVESNGERAVRQYLDKNKILYNFQKTFDDCYDIKSLPFDFYLPEYNACIEYDGEQHFKSVEYFGGKDSFKKTVMHDNIKNDYCKNNNIKLLRIPYYANVEEELNNFLFI